MKIESRSLVTQVDPELGWFHRAPLSLAFNLNLVWLWCCLSYPDFPPSHWRLISITYWSLGKEKYQRRFPEFISRRPTSVRNNLIFRKRWSDLKIELHTDSYRKCRRIKRIISNHRVNTESSRSSCILLEDVEDNRSTKPWLQIRLRWLLSSKMDNLERN